MTRRNTTTVGKKRDGSGNSKDPTHTRGLNRRMELPQHFSEHGQLFKSYSKGKEGTSNLTKRFGKGEKGCYG